jgi:hypothetical protein
MNSFELKDTAQRAVLYTAGGVAGLYLANQVAPYVARYTPALKAETALAIPILGAVAGMTYAQRNYKPFL